MSTTDIISPQVAKNLSGLFKERLKRSPDAVAYRQFDPDTSTWKELRWSDVSGQIARWQAALLDEGLKAGDRVAVMLPNCSEWVIFDQAALGLGLVTVPLYLNARLRNITYILEDTGARLLLIGDQQQWRELSQASDRLTGVDSIVSLQPVDASVHKGWVKNLTDWLPQTGNKLHIYGDDPTALATIVYTSGTTGRPKGVMLSHDNILRNAYGTLQIADVYPDDRFLSFLPLSHTFERTVGYYLPMMAGSTVVYARSVDKLAEDLLEQQPTVLVSVPRIYERFNTRIAEQLENQPLARYLFKLTVKIGWTRFEYQQGRGPWRPSLLLWPWLEKRVAARILARLGGRIRIAVSGGAALSPDLARQFVSLGLPLSQGYGLTEHSPVVSANPLTDNYPTSVGTPLPDVEVRIGEHEELQVRSRSVMLGYWNNPQATAEVIKEGWLLTGDQAHISHGHIYITGRLKEIIVLANGEKITPAELEKAIANDPLFEQVMIIGEERPFVSALVVPDQKRWEKLADEHNMAAHASPPANEEAQDLLLERISRQLKDFPDYAQVHRVALIQEPWTVDNGLLTPTLKLRRQKIVERHSEEVERLYEGH